MADERKFTCFRALPAELRDQIWEEALLDTKDWTVWGILKSAPFRGKSHRPALGFMGATHHTIGMSCREARDVQQRFKAKGLLEVQVDFSNTVVCLGRDQSALAFTKDPTCHGISDEDFSKIEHVVILHTCRDICAPTWGRQNLRNTLQASQNLLWMCERLRTIIIERSESPEGREPLGIEKAARLVEIAKNDEPEVGPGKMECPGYRGRLYGSSWRSRTKIHIIPDLNYAGAHIHAWADFKSQARLEED
jgi:hypothetical protein